MEEVEALRNKISEKILRDSVNGTSDIEKLPLNLAVALLKIHNKRCVQFIIEFGYYFEDYISDFHKEFLKIFDCIELSLEKPVSIRMLRNIEHNMIYSPNSIFLHGHDLVLNSEIKALLGLHEAGFLNFDPCRAEELSKHLFVNEQGRITIKNESDLYKRSWIGNLPVLINTPNKIDLSDDFANKHFRWDTPQFVRYKEAIAKANNDAKSLKQMSDVFSSMIVMDVAIKNITSKMKKAISGCKDSISEFSEILNQFQVDESIMNKKFKKNCMVLSDLNQILGFVLSAPNLKNMNRGSVLEFIFDKNNNVKSIGDFLLKHELIHIN